MSHSPEVKFSFKNLEPINYLKTFNKMIDYQSRNSSQDNKKPELKIVSLSKFPTPKDYENMEGIFENVNKKKVENDMNKYNKQIEQEQKFIKKHNEFMRKVLQKFIQHNQSRQKNYEKQKIFYSKDFKTGNHLRSLSQAKLGKLKKDLKDNEKTIDNENTQGKKATLGSQMFTDSKSEHKSIEILPKLQPRKKKGKITLKKQRQIEQYVINRKLTNPEVVSSARSRPTQYQEQADNIDFKAEIIQLQRKQAKVQSNFTERIQKEIDQFKRKMSIQVHAINYYNFWNEKKEEDQSQQERQKQKQKTKQKLKESEDRVDYSTKFRSYQQK